MEKKIYVYGFDELHRVKDYMYLQGSDISVRNIIKIASAMEENGFIRRIYAIDNMPGLKEDFWKAIKTRDFTQHIEFEDEVKRDGILIRSVNG